MSQVILPAALRTLREFGYAWVCAGPGLHGYSAPQLVNGRPQCPQCPATGFVKIDEAIRRADLGLPLQGSRAA